MVRLAKSPRAGGSSDALASLRAAIIDRYPDLRFHDSDGLIRLRGTFPVRDGETVLDRFQIEMFFVDGLNFPPITFEIGNRIPRIVDRHIYNAGLAPGAICTDVPELILLRGYSLPSYLDGPAHNYFLGQCLVELGQPWPFGQWDHGKPGLLQAYGEILGVRDESSIEMYLACLNHREIKGHFVCPCGSGKKLRLCHANDLRRLHEMIPRSIAEMALHRLRSYSA